MLQRGWVRHRQPLRVPTSGTKYLPLMGTQTSLTYPLSSHVHICQPHALKHTHMQFLHPKTHIWAHINIHVHTAFLLLSPTHTLLLQRFRWESSEEIKCQRGFILQIWLFIMKGITGKCLDVKALLYLTLGCAVFWVYLDRWGRLVESILCNPERHWDLDQSPSKFRGPEIAF